MIFFSGLILFLSSFIFHLQLNTSSRHLPQLGITCKAGKYSPFSLHYSRSKTLKDSRWDNYCPCGGGEHLQKLIQLEGKTLLEKKNKRVSGSFQGTAPLGMWAPASTSPCTSLVNTTASLLTAMRHLLCARPMTLQILERILSPNSKSNILFICQILS